MTEQNGIREGQNPPSFLGIHEPMTVLTDILMGVFGAYFGIRLLWDTAQQPSQVALAATMFFLAAAGFLGGIYHAWAPTIPDRSRKAIWLLTLQFTGIASFFLLATVAVRATDGVAQWILLGVATLKLIIFVLRSKDRRDFALAARDAGLSIVGVAVIATIVLLTRDVRWSMWALGGAGAALAGAIIQMSGWGFHRHFNNNDIFHVAQIGATYLFFRAGMVF